MADPALPVDLPLQRYVATGIIILTLLPPKRKTPSFAKCTIYIVSSPKKKKYVWHWIANNRTGNSPRHFHKQFNGVWLRQASDCWHRVTEDDTTASSSRTGHCYIRERRRTDKPFLDVNESSFKHRCCKDGFHYNSGSVRDGSQMISNNAVMYFSGCRMSPKRESTMYMPCGPWIQLPQQLNGGSSCTTRRDSTSTWRDAWHSGDGASWVSWTATVRPIRIVRELTLLDPLCKVHVTQIHLKS